MTEQYFSMSPEQAEAALGSTKDGLSAQEAADRLEKYGANELPKGKKKGLLARFIDQFKNVMIIVLIVAGLISGFMGEVGSTVIIMVVVVLNAIMGVVQEGKAEKSLEALQKMSASHARVRRGGQVIEVDSMNLVPGDVVLLEAGNTAPADIRLTTCASLKVEEAALTGESVPSEKSIEAIPNPEAPLGDRVNMVYSGGNVVYGRGEGIVTSTGAATEVGKIAMHLGTDAQQTTPLQKKLAELSKILTIGVLIIAVIVFGVGMFWGRSAFDMFMTAVSLAVSAIPEGLPAVVTILLAMGVQRMAKQNAIIRKLSAVETLGCTEIICSDKTGTLTQNRMTVTQLWLPEGGVAAADFTGSCQPLMQALTLCNDVSVEQDGKLLGDPTETALVELARKKGWIRGETEAKYPRVGELPFDSERKLMTTAHTVEGGIRILTKGAPDMLLTRCTSLLVGGATEPMTVAWQQKILAQIGELSSQALRVLCYAYKDVSSLPEKLTTEADEQGLTFCGLTGMIDPPRDEVRDAVAVCRKAGIRPIMITGDHEATAVAIAKNLGILDAGGKAITGAALEKLSDEVFDKTVQEYSVYARVAPEHKVRIVKAWQKLGKVVAMTGDGVNDAPALNTADIGVGMGITGTDVSKSVSAMVLTDDNFATIVTAVKEGRTIYANIQRAIQFLLSTNLGEVVFLFFGTLLNRTVMLPIHILWINLVTDTFPALALGFEQAEKDMMSRPPRSSSASFLSGGVGASVVYQGILSGSLTLASYFVGELLYGTEVAVTMAFLTVGAVCMFHSLNMRSATQSLFTVGIFGNTKLLLAILVSGLLHVSVMVIPMLRNLFELVALTPAQWALGVGIAALVIPVVEVVKLFIRIRSR
ncbi:MAG: cation-translocating P-type ATPase [Angelakisella sp.]